MKLSNPCNLSVKCHVLILEIRKLITIHREKWSDEGGDVEFWWIPSHLGCNGNDIVDKVAKNATLVQNIRGDVFFTDTRSVIKSFCFNQTQNAAIERGKIFGQFYFDYFYENCAKPWYHKKCWPRVVISVINRLRANHSSLAESLARKDIISSALCKCGVDDETFHHILFDCIFYVDSRGDLLYNLNELIPTCTDDWRLFFKLLNKDCLVLIFEFLKKYNIKI